MLSIIECPKPEVNTSRDESKAQVLNDPDYFRSKRRVQHAHPVHD